MGQQLFTASKVHTTRTASQSTEHPDVATTYRGREGSQSATRIFRPAGMDSLFACVKPGKEVCFDHFGRTTPRL